MNSLSYICPNFHFLIDSQINPSQKGLFWCVFLFSITSELEPIRSRVTNCGRQTRSSEQFRAALFFMRGQLLNNMVSVRALEMVKVMGARRGSPLSIAYVTVPI